MSTNNLQSLDNLLADLFREPALTSIREEASSSASPSQPDADGSVAQSPAIEDPVPSDPSWPHEPDAEPVVHQTSEVNPLDPPFVLHPQPDFEPPSIKAAAVDPASQSENVARLAEKARLALEQLDLETAMRLRWALRDIRAKRTKLSPVSPSDLKTLMDLGLVAQHEDRPALTDIGSLALD